MRERHPPIDDFDRDATTWLYHHTYAIWRRGRQQQVRAAGTVRYARGAR